MVEFGPPDSLQERRIFLAINAILTSVRTDPSRDVATIMAEAKKWAPDLKEEIDRCVNVFDFGVIDKILGEINGRKSP